MNQMEIKISIANYNEIIKQLEKIKELLNDIKNIKIEVNKKNDIKDLIDILRKSVKEKE